MANDTSARPSCAADVKPQLVPEKVAIDMNWSVKALSSLVSLGGKSGHRIQLHTHTQIHTQEDYAFDGRCFARRTVDSAAGCCCVPSGSKSSNDLVHTPPTSVVVDGNDWCRCQMRKKRATRKNDRRGAFYSSVNTTSSNIKYDASASAFPTLLLEPPT